MNVEFPRLYAIMDGALLRTSERAFAQILAQSGVELIQYRSKQASSRRLLQVSREIAAVLRPHGTRFIVNDRPDIAVLAAAEGVHVGQADLPVSEARAICGDQRLVGVSTHNLQEFQAASNSSADYIAVGPIFPTETKERPDPVVGIEFIRTIRRLTRKPVVAIGGISLESAAEVWRAGADSVAVARDLAVAADPGARARAYLDLAASVGSQSA